MELETDAMRQELLTTLGAVCVKCNRGQFDAILDNEFVETENSPTVETKQPVLTCRTSDLDCLEVRKNSQVVIGDETYRVQRHEPDGSGMSRLVLRR